MKGIILREEHHIEARKHMPGQENLGLHDFGEDGMGQKEFPMIAQTLDIILILLVKFCYLNGNDWLLCILILAWNRWHVPLATTNALHLTWVQDWQLVAQNKSSIRSSLSICPIFVLIRDVLLESSLYGTNVTSLLWTSKKAKKNTKKTDPLMLSQKYRLSVCQQSLGLRTNLINSHE